MLESVGLDHGSHENIIGVTREPGIGTRESLIGGVIFGVPITFTMAFTVGSSFLALTSDGLLEGLDGVLKKQLRRVGRLGDMQGHWTKECRGDFRQLGLSSLWEDGPVLHGFVDFTVFVSVNHLEGLLVGLVVLLSLPLLVAMDLTLVSGVGSELLRTLQSIDKLFVILVFPSQPALELDF